MGRKSLIVRCAVALGCLLAPVFSTPVPVSAGGVYFVKPGDTLTRISRLFGVDGDLLRKINRLETDNIAPGDKIRLPDKPAAAVAAVQPPTPSPAVATVPPPPPPPPPIAAVVPPPDPVVAVAPHREVSSDRVLQAVCRDETVYHAVAGGDTLSSISRRYDTELESLLQLNGLRKNSRLSIGQKIIVRKSGPRSHTVSRGETLARIASRYGIGVAEIVRLNKLAGGKITAGQRLQIEPCDPYAVAGSAPPPLGGASSDISGAGGLSATGAESASGSALGEISRGVSVPAATIAQQVISLARTMLNVPYRFGGSSLRGIDCSAYVQRVFGLLDVQIPRTAREQYGVGASIGRDEMHVGDLVFFRTYASYPSHVGIYLGENLFIHASSMVRKVAIDSMDQPYYRKRFIGARRLIVDSAPAVASTP